MRKEAIVFGYGRRWDRRNCKMEKFQSIPEKISERKSGIYVLYNKNRIVYIGKSEKNLKDQIKRHLSDRLKDKCDSFTWFIAKRRYTHDLEALLHKIFTETNIELYNKLVAQFVFAKKDTNAALRKKKNKQNSREFQGDST